MAEHRVAVVGEDDPDVRDLIEMVLAQSGFIVVHAADGPAAIEAVREHQPLLTTLDVNMPGLDGFEVAKRLREFSRTYLIMITALTQEVDIIRGFEAGADDYLVKPFRPRELRARADSMLRRAAFASDNGVPAPAAAPAPPEPEPVPESWAAAAAREFRAEMSPDTRDQLERNYVGRRVRQVEEPVSPPPAAPTSHVAPAPYSPPPVAAAAPTPAPAYVPPTPEPARADGMLRFRGLVIDPTTGSAALDGRALGLDEAQVQLLASLMESGRRVRSKADLVLALRGQQYVTSHFVNEADKRQVEAHIAGLRRKLGDDEASPRFIETVRGVGFRMAEA